MCVCRDSCSVNLWSPPVAFLPVASCLTTLCLCLAVVLFPCPSFLSSFLCLSRQQSPLFVAGPQRDVHPVPHNTYTVTWIEGKAPLKLASTTQTPNIQTCVLHRCRPLTKRNRNPSPVKAKGGKKSSFPKSIPACCQILHPVEALVCCLSTSRIRSVRSI